MFWCLTCFLVVFLFLVAASTRARGDEAARRARRRGRTGGGTDPITGRRRGRVRVPAAPERDRVQPVRPEAVPVGVRR